MKKAMLYIVALMFSAGVNAATWDFAAIADAAPGEYGASSILFSDPSGISVTATADGTSGTMGPGVVSVGDYAYLDSGNAGLGACGALSSTAQCIPGNDDNVQMGEALTLTFNAEIELTQFTFLNGSHATDFTGIFDLFIDGILVADDMSLTAMNNGSWIGTTFRFLNESNNSYASGNQFYISSVTAVPVPAALFLFAPALLGFFGLRRKATLAA